MKEFLIYLVKKYWVETVVFLIFVRFVEVPLGNFLQLTIPYLFQDGHSYFFSENFVDIRAAARVTSKMFFVLDPSLTNDQLWEMTRNFVPQWRTNVLDLFRWCHFRTCIEDPAILQQFDQIFRYRFAGLSPERAMPIFHARDWTIGQLYSFEYLGKGFVTAEEIRAQYRKACPDQLITIANNPDIIFNHAYNNFSKTQASTTEWFPFSLFSFEG